MSPPTTACPSPKRAFSLFGQRSRPATIDIEDGQASDAKFCGGECDSGAGTARADLYNTVQRYVGQSPPETLGKAPPVGVMPDTFAIAQQDGVDRTDRGSIAGKLRQQRHDRLLAWMRDVHAREAHAFRSRDQFAERIDTEPQPFEVDQLVDAAESVLGLLHLHAGRGARSLDTGADQAQQHRWSTADWHAGGSPVTRPWIGACADGAKSLLTIWLVHVNAGTGPGLRVGYEELAWGRHVNRWRHAWNIVRSADHNLLGLSFSTAFICLRWG